MSYVNIPSVVAMEIGGGTAPDQLATGFARMQGSVVTTYLLSPVGDEDNPAVLEHKRIMQLINGPAVSSLSVYGQVLAETLVETLNRACDKLTREAVMEAAESLEAFQPSLLLPGITITLGDEDHLSIETLQPAQIGPDGSLTALGGPVEAPAPAVTPQPTGTPEQGTPGPEQGTATPGGGA